MGGSKNTDQGREGEKYTLLYLEERSQRKTRRPPVIRVTTMQ